MHIQGPVWGIIWECTYPEKKLLSCSDGQLFEEDTEELTEYKERGGIFVCGIVFGFVWYVSFLRREIVQKYTY